MATHLVYATWDQARELAPATEFTAAVDAYVQRNAPTANFKPAPLAWAPLDAKVAAGLLLSADHILNRDSAAAVRQELHNLLPDKLFQAGRTSVARHFFDSRDECSPALQRALTPGVRRYSCTRRAGQRIRAPELHTDLPPENVPQQIPHEIAEPHLRQFTGISHRLLHRYAAIRLVQMIIGGSLGDAAFYLGVKAIPNPSHGYGRVWGSGSTVGAWIRRCGVDEELRTAIGVIAQDLRQRPAVNYHHRRAALHTWALPAPLWHRIIDQHAPGSVGVDYRDEFFRLHASATIWSKTVLSERCCAPPCLLPVITSHAAPNGNHVQQRLPIWICGRPSRSPKTYTRRLTAALDSVAADLRATVDSMPPGAVLIGK
ncbi:hypothetical protein [Nocardia coffeae]|uniref:hypothetical protein n=1 Tax=Nocardia coffeae TaxID=2873381 RepID=UPI001F274068|nr:hypothetical protein [Nocardia coffeae]